MKTSYGTILVLATVAAVLFTTALPCRAAEKEEESIWSEDEPKGKGEGKRFELTEERIERIMNRLVEADPEKAEELKQLREKDLEKFKAELREAMRQQFGKRFRERLKEHPEQQMKKYGGPFGPGGMPPGVHGMPPGMGMHWRYDRYLDWLKENYAEEAEKLAELREKDMGLYWKQFGLSLKKYGKIAEAARENPQLAEVLKEDLLLKQQRDELLEEIKTAGDDEREGLVNELKEVVSSRFDLIVKRKQIEYEQLFEKLEKLKKRVEESEAKVEKWKDVEFKNESVKARLEELLSKTDEFRW